MPEARAKSSPEDILVGGQAVIEGVMMRTPHAYAVAVRHADGTTEVKKEAVRRLSAICKPLSWPVIRGFAVLLQSLVLGIRTLNFSFNAAMADADPKPDGAGKTTGVEATQEGGWLPVVLSMGAALVAAVVIFILAPLWLTTW